jgi:hypothetical protein
MQTEPLEIGLSPGHLLHPPILLLKIEFSGQERQALDVRSK